MSVFTRSLLKTLKGSAKAFQTFPASIFCALAFAIVTMVRIQLNWPQQEPYNFIFNCLHWTFALGALSSLAAITAARCLDGGRKAFITANLFGVATALITFLLLYFLGATDSYYGESRYMVVSNIASARVVSAMVISFFAFVVLAAYPKEQTDFARSFFMTHKAFFIAMIYGLVIMAGASGVAGAFQSLIYHDMSEKVYMYISTIVGFLAYTIFLGYFPDFRKDQMDEHREVAQKQPRFIEVLFGYIMIPIVLALTIVLLLWAGKTIMTGDWPPFWRLASIATAYTVGGIWLHVMVTKYETGIARFYKKAYPATALVILAFEAWALLVQLGKWGLKTEEYTFGLLWILGFVAAILLLVLKARAHLPIVVLICILAVVAVVPTISYNDLPISVQSGRLEKLLEREGILANGTLTPATKAPDDSVRESVTDSVNFLANAHDAKLPVWFNRELNNDMEFEKTLGFAKKWPAPEGNNGGGSYLSTYVSLPAGAYDIGDYKWAIRMTQEKEVITATIAGDRGSYDINWNRPFTPGGIPQLQIALNGRMIIDQNMNSLIDKIAEKYPPGQMNNSPATFEDMSMKLETPEISVLLVFSNVNIDIDPQGDTINYWIGIDTIYFNEKP